MKRSKIEGKKVLVTGGAGFVGSHLIDRLMNAGEEVICLDNYFTGRKTNIAQWMGHSRFELIRHDVTDPIQLECDRIWHLACPASPVHYQFNPINLGASIKQFNTYLLEGNNWNSGFLLLGINYYSNFKIVNYNIDIFEKFKFLKTTGKHYFKGHLLIKKNLINKKKIEKYNVLRICKR